MPTPAILRARYLPHVLPVLEVLVGRLRTLVPHELAQLIPCPKRGITWRLRIAELEFLHPVHAKRCTQVVKSVLEIGQGLADLGDDSPFDELAQSAAVQCSASQGRVRISLSVAVLLGLVVRLPLVRDEQIVE